MLLNFFVFIISGFLFFNKPRQLFAVTPVPSSFSPISGANITDNTPTITFTTDEDATCRLSLIDESYDEMSDDITCSESGTTSQSCTSSDLGANGAKNLYIACTDGSGNKDTSETNENLAYTLVTVTYKTATLDTTGIQTDGTVYSIVNDGTSTYIGGSFTTVKPTTGTNTKGGVVSTTDGTLTTPFPKVNETIYASISDGAGGWYIGGEFTQVGATEISYLAHIKSDGTLDSSFNPSPNNTVYALSLSGNYLYVGGSFTSIGGQEFQQFARLSKTTGTADATCDPQVRVNNIPTTVTAIYIDNSSNIYLGGDFDTITGIKRKGLAKLDSNCSLDTGWIADIDSGYVYSVTGSGSDIYVGGNFTTIDNDGVGESEPVPQSYLAKLSATDGNIDQSFNPVLNGTVYTLALSGNYLYFGGVFTTVDSNEIKQLARVNKTSGEVDTSCNLGLPTTAETTRSLVFDGTTGYVGGDFASVNGNEGINSLFRFDTTTCTYDSNWSPNPIGEGAAPAYIYSIAASSPDLWVGGNFDTIDNTSIFGLAYFTLSSPEPTSTPTPTPTNTPTPTPTPIPGDYTSGNVLINKISPLGSGEWVELLNTTASAINLANWSIGFTNPDHSAYTISSGTLPKGGLLTINLTSGANLLDDTSATVLLYSPYSTLINSVTYGSGSIPSAAGNEIIYRQSIGSTAWGVGDTVPKGWFTPDGAPSASTIDSSLGSSGVSTNLGELPDLTQVSNLYFEKPSLGKIQFASTLNLTDSDVVSWLQNLGTKLDLSTQNQIGLDADTVKDLINTQATLTMYNVTLNNPKIQVNGQDDSANVVSGLSYDRTAHTLTFTAAHFTTFKAVENESNSNSNSFPSSSAPICGDQPPSSIPDLFQINTTSTTAKLFFTPISTTSQFFVSFSTKPHAQEHGELVTLLREGVQSHTIYHLKPNTTYYFKVRGQNGCMPGEWSNILKLKTNSQIYYRNSSSTNKSKITIQPIKTTHPQNPPISQTPLISPQPTLVPKPTSSPPKPEPQSTKKCFLWWCW